MKYMTMVKSTTSPLMTATVAIHGVKDSCEHDGFGVLEVVVIISIAVY